MSILDPIRGAVAAASSVIAGAIALLTDLGDRLEAALADDDLEAGQELAIELRAQTDALAEAIAANTIVSDEGGTPTDAIDPAPPADPIVDDSDGTDGA